MSSLGNDTPDPAAPKPDTLIKSVTESAGYKSWLDGANSTGRVALNGFTVKALVGDTAGTGDNEYVTEKPRLPGLFANPQPALTLLDLFPRLSVSSGSVEFV